MLFSITVVWLAIVNGPPLFLNLLNTICRKNFFSFMGSFKCSLLTFSPEISNTTLNCRDFSLGFGIIYGLKEYCYFCFMLNFIAK